MDPRGAPTSTQRDRSPVRVLITCDWFLKYAIEQSLGLIQAGADVALLCRSHSLEFGSDPAERERSLAPVIAAGARLLEIPHRQSDPRAVPALFTLRTRLSAFAPQVAHAHDGADPRALALLRQVPTVLTIHDPAPHLGHPVPARKKRWFLDGSKQAWRDHADVIVVHSERLRDELSGDESKRSCVIAHGMTVLAEPLPPPPQPMVSFFGRLAPYKGLDTLAAAMPLVWQRRPDVRLQVAGAGDTPFDLPDERVAITRGYLPEHAVEAFFRDTSLAVLPYTQASQTGVGSVAVGFGVPIVVSQLGGLADLSLDKSYVVTPGDPASLAESILGHVDDGLDTRQRVLTELAAPRSWTAVAAQSLALYENIVDR